MLLVASCAPADSPESETQIVGVYATPSTQPWLADVFACAPAETVIRVADAPASADISLRLGEPDFAPDYVYQIDTEEILIVTHRQSPVQNMSVDEVRELFAGQGDPSVGVWVYASGEDVQRVFEQAVMDGRSVTSLARLATSPGHMSDTLNNEPNTVGVLPRPWKAGTRVLCTPSRMCRCWHLWVKNRRGRFKRSSRVSKNSSPVGCFYLDKCSNMDIIYVNWSAKQTSLQGVTHE